MALFEVELRTYLLSQSELTSLISTRLYFQKAIQNTTYPYVVYTIIVGLDENFEVGDNGSKPTVRFMIFDTTAISTITISNVIRDILHEKCDVDIGANIIQYSRHDGFKDLIDEDDGYYLRISDYTIQYKRE